MTQAERETFLAELDRLRAENSTLRAENQALKESRSIPWDTLTSSPVAIQVFGADGMTVFLNTAQARFLGMEDASLPVGRFNVLTDPFTKKSGQYPLFERVYAGELVTVPELRIELPRNDPRWRIQRTHAWFEQVLFPIFSPDGQVEYVVSFIIDITARKDSEAALLSAQRHQSLALLAGGIAHDFNNLLTTILGNASLASLPGAGSADVQEALEQVVKAAEHASALTRQMLAYAGRGALAKESVSLAALVRDMRGLLRVSVPRNITLTVVDESGDTAVLADPSQLRQVLMNLMTNAADAVGDEHGVVTMQTSTIQADADYLMQVFGDSSLKPGRYVALEISDTGCGMLPEVQQRIFEPFFTTKSAGHGLGLAAVLGIIKSHGGGMRVYSEPTAGTTMKVLLPAMGRATASASAEKIPLPSPARKATILVVDDEKPLRLVARRILEREGYTVVEACDGTDAIEKYQQHTVDLVLLDLTMPRTNGTVAFRELRRLNPEVRVLLTSGYSEQSSTPRFAGKGLAGFLQKPYSAKRLIEAVYGLLGD